MPAAIQLDNLQKRYGALQALAGVGFDVEEGDFFGLLGPNGAGKTTLISILAGLTRADAGSARVLGHDVVSGYRHSRRLLGVVPQELVFDPFFSVRETLRIQSGYFGLSNNDAWIDEIMHNLDLTSKADANMRALSGGMKRRVLVAQALVHKPPVIVLDEPTAGVDVALRQTLWQFIARLNREGHTIVLTTHYLEEAQALCKRVAMLQQGRVVALESTASLLARFDAAQLILHFSAGRLPYGLADRAVEPATATTSERVALRLAAAGDVEPILAACRESGAVVDQVSIERADLEDVFMQIMSGARGNAAVVQVSVPSALLRPDFDAAEPRLPEGAVLGAYTGFRTLFYKESLRFWKVGYQTVGAPILTSVLYLMIFSHVLEDHVKVYGHVSYTAFLIPGLVMMSMLQNAFANSTSSLIQSKISGNLVFVLLTPLSHREVYAAYVLASMVRGLVVGVGVLLATLFFAVPDFAAPLWIVVFALLATAGLGTLGLIAGVWAEKFDQVAAFQNFLIMPATFLSGVFYSVHTLPPFWQAVSHANPFFYMIDGFRYGFFGVSDVSPWTSFAIVGTTFVVLAAAALRLLASGYKTRY